MITHLPRIARRTLFRAAVLLVMGACAPALSAKSMELRYGHMNSPNSVAGMQAQMFADKVAKYTNGEVTIKVYPSSQLGKMQEMAEATSTGVIAISHNTAGGTGSLYEPFGAFDTPYLYRDVDHLMKVTASDSPLMQEMNEGLIDAAGVRVLYTYYFGTRHLTTNKAVRTPADLSGQKIRALPFPIYMTGVEALGAVPVPVDWSEVPTALATGQVSGQENPVNVVLSNKLYESQSHLMLTGHIMNAQVIVMNQGVWKKLTDAQRQAFEKAALEVRAEATDMVQQQEAEELAKLKELKMTVIGPDEGLELDAFKAAANKLVNERFAGKYGQIYTQIGEIK
ncbi:TRAP transporter substrate-binding protein [Pollutimonas thiosulfatoxidans]|uniref:ABC transporter substrate-binding protein n=1 Tax=Pollutimonas thiosulfatoxidans TaxID=2028345 RepID=A0A410GG49_9BURK|nr:TRAP transporter substrate-binding protein [Pollutimonas thiosulfatoxidans]MBF6618066.1 TRAP transporter substrate-binding protein [Candidimonas sp.]NYT45468.1 TRAP transporter substrate-binding protein [Alcaligenaceae bacterium]QAA95260.1 ABC transporter substrate-binding protein [Pollutimonas thiosulfatoxidans]